MYIIGKTGTGKTTLLQNMIVSDIKEGNGLAVIDPSGDLAEELLNYIPKRRIKDVIYFKPGDLMYPIGFNPLEKVDSDQRHLVASGLISVFKKTWYEFWGPRLEHILRNAILALLEYPQSTLLDLPALLVDRDMRQKVVAKVSNPQVRNFWFNEFEKYSAWLKSEATSPILNKVGQYLSTPVIRNILGQPESAFSFREVMDKKRILIVNLSKGQVGEDNCSLLGTMIVTQFHLAALNRSEVPEKKRQPFYLYVDEIHSFATLSFADILSEARKYGLKLIITHQYIEQLDDKIRAAIFGNVGTLISFRIGQEDARALAREFSPIFEETDLVNLPNYNIYLKLMIDGLTSKAFSAVTLPPPQRNRSYKLRIIENSKIKYAKLRSEVEEEMILREQKQASLANKSYEQKLPL